VISQAALDLAHKLLARRFIIWHRPRRAKKWKQVGGEYSDVRDAVAVVLEQSEKVGGNWKALLVGVDPDAKEDDEEEWQDIPSPEGITPENVDEALAAAELLAPCPEFAAFLKSIREQGQQSQATPKDEPKPRKRRNP
jgi:hypothetical protein